MLRNKNTDPQRPVAVEVTADEVIVTLANGDVLRNPLYWHPWLEAATPEQRAHVEFDTFSVDWPDLDEGLDIEGMRQGIPSDPLLRGLAPQDRESFNRIQESARDPEKRKAITAFMESYLHRIKQES